MPKKTVIVTLIAALALALVVHPALAKKRKPKPKPWKSPEVTLLLPHPVAYSTTGAVNSITAREFEQTCAIPTTNGVDGYVFAVPKAYQSILSAVDAKGAAGGAAGYDLDMYLYDKNCKQTLPINASGTDESGTLPKGTAYIFLHNYLGDPGTKAHIELKAL